MRKRTQHHRLLAPKKQIMVLLGVLFLLLIWAGYQGYNLFSITPIIESKHTLKVLVINETEAEIYKARGRTDIWWEPLGTLVFGTLLQGGNSTMTRTFENPYIYPTAVSLHATGNITPYLTLDSPNDLISSGGNYTMTLLLRVPLDAPIGVYTGNLTVRLVPQKEK